MKGYWQREHRYDWYDSRKRGNFLERRFYEGKIRYILNRIPFNGRKVLDLACGGVSTEDHSRHRNDNRH